jgi:hypothetical protein
MPNPVPIPTGPLTVTDADTDRAEAFVAAITQVFQSGTLGVTDPLRITPPTIYPQGPDTAATSLVLSTKEQQLFFRQLGIAIARSWESGGGTPVTPTNANTFVGPCLSSAALGDLVYIASAGMAVRKADPVDYLKLPSVGCIIEKETSTIAVVQTSGIVTSPYTGLTPGRSYFVGLDGRPALTPPAPSPGELLFHQPIGIALDVTVMLLIPSINLTRVRGN